MLDYPNQQNKNNSILLPMCTNRAIETNQVGWHVILYVELIKLTKVSAVPRLTESSHTYCMRYTVWANAALPLYFCE